MPLPITQIFGLFGSFGKLMQFLSTEKKNPKKLKDYVWMMEQHKDPLDTIKTTTSPCCELCRRAAVLVGGNLLISTQR